VWISHQRAIDVDFIDVLVARLGRLETLDVTCLNADGVRECLDATLAVRSGALTARVSVPQ
jgi:hypothetical protein